MNTDCVTVSTIVAVDPATAFAIFTSEIAVWWKPKVPGLFRRGRNGTLKFDSGRLLKSTARASRSKSAVYSHGNRPAAW